MLGFAQQADCSGRRACILILKEEVGDGGLKKEEKREEEGEGDGKERRGYPSKEG